MMPNFKNYEDVVYTPKYLAKEIIRAVNPSGNLCDPAAGQGAFYDELRKYGKTDWFEVDPGFKGKEKDFLTYAGQRRWDWIITNPPWSLFGEFLEKSMEHADNIVFLIPFNKLTTTKRMRIIREAGFDLKTVYLCPQPKEWGKHRTGLQLVAAHFEKMFDSPIYEWNPVITDLHIGKKVQTIMERMEVEAA